jgi:hypothetical protein
MNPFAQQTASQVQGVVAGQNAELAGLQKTAANGYNSQASQQYANSVRQNLQGQLALANSAGGGGVGAAGARRSAQENNAMTQAASTAGAQLTAQQAQQQAQGQIGTILGQQGNLIAQNYGMNQQNAYTQAQLQQQQQQQNNQRLIGYNQLIGQEQQQQLGAAQGASQGVIGGINVSQGNQVVNNAQNNAMLGAGFGAASGVLGAATPGISQYVNSPAATAAPPAAGSLAPGSEDTGDYAGYSALGS